MLNVSPNTITQYMETFYDAINFHNSRNFMSSSDYILLVITIDVEEDDWGQYKRTGQMLTNLERLPILQTMFERVGIKPTYLINYPVTCNADYHGFFSSIEKSGTGEIGAHLHPWNTPPFHKNEENSKYYSRLSNFPPNVQFQKIKSLTTCIERNIGTRPRVFRGGRFSYDHNTLKALHRLGYQADTTFTPFTSYNHLHKNSALERFTYDPFKLPLNDCELGNGGGATLWEIPVTIGFNRLPFHVCHTIYEALGAPGIKHLRFRGLMHFLRLVQKLYLSPELSSLEEMKKLTEVIANKMGSRVLNMFFHSPTLKPGLSPFVQNKYEAKMFWARLEEYLEWVQSTWNVKPVTLSECLSSFINIP